MDDLLTKANMIEESKDITQELSHILATAGFKLMDIKRAIRDTNRRQDSMRDREYRQRSSENTGNILASTIRQYSI